MSFPRYPAYKSSGLPWTTLIPVEWDLLPIKRVCVLLMGQSPSSDDCNKDGIGMPFLQGNAEFGKIHPSPINYCQVSSKIAPPGAILLSVRAPVGALNIADQSYGIGRGLCAFLPKEMLSRDFTRYTLEASRQGLASVATGSTYEAVSLAQVAVLKIPLPSISEQKVISTFLDHETAKIDSLIAEQQRLIELLQEKRQAVISHAVTKGLNPDAPMKDSGVEWLGEVPEHWGVMSLKRILVNIEQGWSPDCLATLAADEEWGVVKAGCLNGGEFNPLEHKTLPSSLEPVEEYQISAGDLLMSRASGSPDLIGSVAYIEQVRPRLMMSDKIFRLRTTNKAEGRYLAMYLGSLPVRQQIRLAISGAAGLANNLPQQAIKDFLLVLPPLDVQREIIDFLRKKSAEFQTLSEHCKSSVKLLQERRSALISSAVTGQIDVRGLVPMEAAA